MCVETSEQGLFLQDDQFEGSHAEVCSKCYLWFLNGNIASIYIWRLTAGGLKWSLNPQQ